MTDCKTPAAMKQRGVILQRRTQPAPTWVWIGCSSVLPLWEAVRQRNDIEILQRPTNQPWALEVKIHDPDKNILWFGSESLGVIPFESEPV